MADYLLIFFILLFGAANAVIGAWLGVAWFGKHFGAVLRHEIDNLNLTEDQARWIIKGLER